MTDEQEQKGEQEQPDWVNETVLGSEQIGAIIDALGDEGMTASAEVAFHFEMAWRESQILVAIEKGFIRLERDEDDPDLWNAIRNEDDMVIWAFRIRHKIPNAAIGQPEFN